MSQHKVLISGASIAGPTLGYFLTQGGFDVTIVEQAASIRLGGQSIDVNGPAKKVARIMKIEDAILKANTGEVGTQWVDKDNQVKASFPKDGAASLTQEMEIVRGDLVSILYELTKSAITYIFDDRITSLSQDDQKVDVQFASGRSDTFDLVVAADGIRSKTRKLMFGDEPVFKYLGMCTAYLTIEKSATDTNWARWYTADDSRVLLLRPDRQGTTRAAINFLLSEEDYSNLDKSGQMPLLLDRLEDAGWEAPRLAQEVQKSEDLYFDGIGQIHAPNWSKGRYAMVGDAACCPAPVSGKGATLAMVGAYVLAGELSKHKSHEDAFAGYEAVMRPYVKSVQDLPPGVPWLAYPKTAFGVSVINTAASIMASAPVQKIAEMLSSSDPKKEELMDGKELPDYRFDR